MMNQRQRCRVFARQTKALGLVAALMLLGSAAVQAQEQCGIPEVMLRDGFEPDALPGPLIFPDNAPLAITLDAGQAGSTVAGPTTIVSGTFSGPPGTGIGARNRPAVRVGNRWLIPNVPLNAGSDTITITATTLAGATATQTLNLTRDDSTAAQARLSVETLSPTGSKEPLMIAVMEPVGGC